MADTYGQSQPQQPVNALALANQAAQPPAETAPSPDGAQGPDQAVAEKLLRWANPFKTLNIAEELDADVLSKIGIECMQGYEVDNGTRTEWLQKSKDAMKLAMQVAEQKNTPWVGASNIIYPLMTSAAIQFAARAYPAIISGSNVVKGKVYGKDDGTPVMAQDGTPQMQIGQDGKTPQMVWQIEPGQKQRRADAIAEHMSYQYLEEQREWEPQTDKMLHILPIVGCAFRKTYFDAALGRKVGLLVHAENLVINYWAESLEMAPRSSEEIKLYPVEIIEKQRAGVFLEQDYGIAASSTGDKEEPHEFIEQHCRYDLDEDGYPEPYIVTIHKETRKVARIIARYDVEGVKFSRRTGKVMKIEPIDYYDQYDFLPNIEGGIYGMGLGQLLTPLNAAVNSSLNMMMDGAHRRIVGGGFIGRGLSMHSGSIKFKMGEYKVVNAPGARIREAIVDAPVPPPDGTLFQLLGMLLEAAREVSSVKDVMTGELSAKTMQPTTLLALIEQGMKVFTAIYKRYYRTAQSEYKKAFRINRIYLDDEVEYQRGDVWKTITRQDYQEGAGVEPYADPTMVSDMQELAKAQFLQPYQQDPFCDPMEVRRRIFTAAKIPDIDKVLREPESPPIDPKVLAMADELQIKAMIGKADALLKMTGAMKNLADVDATVGETHMGWINTEMDRVRLMMEHWNARAERAANGLPEPSDETEGDAGDNGEGLPSLAPPPGDQGVPPVSQ